MSEGLTSDTLELRRLLQDSMRRSGLGVLVFYVISLGISMILTTSMLNHSARQLGRTLRNELLVGNNAYATKIINQNMQGQFARVEYLQDNRPLFSLHGEEPGLKLFAHKLEVPICLNLEQTSCASRLIFHYSTARYFLVITLIAGGMLLFSCISFLLFRKRLVRVFRQTLTSQKEAALGRLSAQICHDLKLPSLIFQKIAQVQSWQEFDPLRPQLNEHVRRLFSMIDKLKRLDLEGLIRPELFQLSHTNLEALLHSVLRGNNQIKLIMPPVLALVADRDKLERSLANLVLNAEQAGASFIRVEFQIQDFDLLIRVSNNGPEVPAVIVDWFSDREGHRSRVPVGLGLAMVRDTVWGHGGSCRLRSHQNETEFELLFPHAVNTAALSESKLPTAIPVSLPKTAERKGLWMDPELLPLFKEDLASQLGPHFFLTSRVDELTSCSLVVSADPEVIAGAIEHSIPAFHHSPSISETELRKKLQRRLGLLRPLSDSARPSDVPHSPGLHVPHPNQARPRAAWEFPS